jgi:uncharacterized protein
MMRAFPFLMVLLLAAAPAFADAWSLRMEIPAITSDDRVVENTMKGLYRAQGSDKFGEVLSVLEKMAETDAEAAFRLGRYYDVETPVPDYARAIAFYQKAAALGHGFAMNNLGLIYERGNGVAKDPARARELFEASAQARDHHGYLNMARLNFEGKLMPRNLEKGMAWLQEAMDNRVKGSFLDAANVYHGGFFGIEQNRTKALKLLEKAASLGDDDAAGRVASIYLYGDCAKEIGLYSRLRGSDNCIPENPRKGLDLFNLLARRDNKDALTALGNVYWKSDVIPTDSALAVTYWNRAAELGSCIAMTRLAWAYEGSEGFTKDGSKVLDYLEQAVECNPRDAASLYKLGKYYFDEKNPYRDCAKAERYFQRAVASGKREAYTELGFIYDKGCAPVPEDKKKAFGYYLIGAKLNVPLSQNNTGAMLKHGWGVEKNLVKGYAWMQVAAGNGSNAAKKNLLEFDVMFKRQDKLDGVQYIPTIKEMIENAQKDVTVAFDGKY